MPKTGRCEKCLINFTEDDFKYAESGGVNPDTGEISPIGDYDFVCYTCQLEMNDEQWLRFVESKGYDTRDNIEDNNENNYY